MYRIQQRNEICLFVSKKTFTISVIGINYTIQNRIRLCIHTSKKQRSTVATYIGHARFLTHCAPHVRIRAVRPTLD